MKRGMMVIPLVIFMAIMLLLVWQLARNAQGDDPASLESTLIGQPVPLFRLEALEDSKQHFQADVLSQGEPLLLNVWATWCPTCRAEHRYLNQLSAQGIRVVGLNYKDDRLKAIDWLKTLGNPYALSLFDGDGMLGLDLGVSGARAILTIGCGNVNSGRCGRSTVGRPRHEISTECADAAALRARAGRY